MEKEKIIEQIKLYSLRVSAKNLKCSFTNLRYWIKKHQIVIPPLHTNCNRCGEPFARRKAGPAKNLCDKCKHHFKKIGYIKRGLSELQIRIRRKAFLIRELGNGCSKCGYNKNIAALAFHHLNPRDKDFNMNSKKLSKLTLAAARDEADRRA